MVDDDREEEENEDDGDEETEHISPASEQESNMVSETTAVAKKLENHEDHCQIDVKCRMEVSHKRKNQRQIANKVDISQRVFQETSLIS